MEEKEINLVYYLNILYRRRKIILIILILSFLFFGIKYLLPLVSSKIPFLSERFLQTYKIEGVIEIGTLSNGKPIESQAEVVWKINSKIYNSSDCSVKASAIQNTQLVKIALFSSNPDKGKESFKKLCDSIKKEHQKIIEKDKEKINKKIEEIKNRINAYEEEIKSLREKKANTESEMSEIKKEMESLDLSDTSQKSRYSFLTNQYSYKNSEVNQYRSIINSKKKTLETLKSELNTEEAHLLDIRPTEAVKEPAVSSKTFSKKELLSHFLIVVLAGLIIGIVSSFLVEFWQKNRERILSQE
ncbi:hypothetical protein J7J39_00245 [bacterium]|nr:hypothetical protein [bacterium]